MNILYIYIYIHIFVKPSFLFLSGIFFYVPLYSSIFLYVPLYSSIPQRYSSMGPLSLYILSGPLRCWTLVHVWKRRERCRRGGGGAAGWRRLPDLFWCFFVCSVGTNSMRWIDPCRPEALGIPKIKISETFDFTISMTFHQMCVHVDETTTCLKK